MIRRHYIISGRVQGVGFRWFTQEAGELCQVTGWVRNLPDNTVEAEAQGEPECITEFEQAIRLGPGFGRVDDLSMDSVALVDGESGFKIRY